MLFSVLLIASFLLTIFLIAISYRLKVALTIISVLLLVVFIGGYFLLKIFGEAFGEHCEKFNTHRVKEYTIEEYQCIGYAGPPFHKYILKINEKEIASDGQRIDSCTFGFRKSDDIKLKLNFCQQEIFETIENDSIK
ncbi:MAG: hypothetical protein EOP53_09845 [Sphingobacteriales bacterium]|nr:MAG: hypothetical protein EOP53_09845 [Sphingobacteriales bacterium]